MARWAWWLLLGLSLQWLAACVAVYHLDGGCKVTTLGLGEVSVYTTTACDTEPKGREDEADEVEAEPGPLGGEG